MQIRISYNFVCTFVLLYNSGGFTPPPIFVGLSKLLKETPKMKKIFTLAFALVLSGSLVLAQTGSSSSTTQSSGTSTTGSSDTGTKTTTKKGAKKGTAHKKHHKKSATTGDTTSSSSSTTPK
jgi:hypothetical protein